jgi:hypothetical protein
MPFPLPRLTQINAPQQQRQFLVAQYDLRDRGVCSRPAKPSSVQFLVPHSRMQMLRSHRHVLFASRIRSTRSADGKSPAWASGTTVMG